MVALIKIKGTGLAPVHSSGHNARVKMLRRHIDLRAMLKSGSGLELLFAVTIWLTLFAIALSYYTIPIQKASQSALWSWVGTAKMDIALYFAEHGRWPNTHDLLNEEKSITDLAALGIQSVQIRDGSFNLVLGNTRSFVPVIGSQPSQWNLSFRRYRHVPGAPINWSCGESETNYPIEAPPNLTDLDRELLPMVCRK